MAIENGISPSRRYRVSMMSEDETQVQETVTLPINLPNNPATVEIWYQKYIPKGQLVIDIEPAEVVEGWDPVKSESDHEHVGFGDSLDYIGEDEPIVEEEDLTLTLDAGEEDIDESEEDDNGGPFVTGSNDFPKDEM